MTLSYCQILCLSLLFVVSFEIQNTCGQQLQKNEQNLLSGQNPCVSKITCHDCIQSVGCAWCMAPDFGDRPRCFQPAFQTSRGICPEEFIFNPDSIHRIISDEILTRGLSVMQGGGGTLATVGQMQGNYSHSRSESGQSSSSYGSSQRGSASSSGSSSASYGGHYGGGSAASGYGSYSSSGRIYQIRPQSYELKIRVNQPQSISFSYAQAQDYPVDLYYLMDLSKSMEDDKEKLSKLGDLLSKTMRSMTSNFRLGFGSFVDKVLMPYVSTIPKNLQEPCTGCAAPYGYQHTMELTSDTYRFSNEVSNAAVSGNLDAPEGGFDAIMQAIVCKEKIGWRNASRKLLVFSTDAGFHYAGDGKLGGVIAPNDGICHLEHNVYTHSSIQDYPSISQINHKVKEHSINVIFAVTAQQKEVYEKLSRHIEGSSAATLSNDSSNVVELVKEEYKKITSSVEIKDNSDAHITINYYSACLNADGQEILTKKCDKLRVGDEVKFRAEVIVTECPKDRNKWRDQIKIQPIGVDEYLLVDLEIICDCECEHEGHRTYERNSAKCKGKGTYKCGICECLPDHYGRMCECSNNDVGITTEKTTGCRQDNTTAVDCSGRGNCVCNVCECERRPHPNEVISGKFCECDNFSCDRHEKLLCSGPDHGECVCGQCICKPGWTGNACDCKASNATCIPPNGGEICSGHGKCECGQCVCDKTDEGRYSGKHCERCPTCAGRCEELKDCVQCQMYKTGKLKDEKACSENCTTFVPVGVEKAIVDEEKNEYLCQFYDEDDCRFQFVYTEVEDGKIEVRAEQERKCPPKVFMLGIVLAVIAAIVLFGLAILLLWKLFTTIHDRREFARFEKERMMAKWDTGENPIYKQATSTFKNPMYAGK